MLTADAATQAIEAIKAASPAVWNAAYQQALVEGWEQAVGAGFGIFASLVMLVKFWRLDPDDEAILHFVFLLPLLLAIILGVQAVDNLVNPSYAALQNITQLIPH